MPNYTDDDDRTTGVSIPRPLVEEGGGRGYLMVLASGVASNVGKMIRLDRAELVLGRSSDADIHIDDEGVSRQHAKFIRREGRYLVMDLGSTNGTLVNGENVTEVPLKDGDKIQVGSTTVLTFAVKDALEENFAKSLYESATRDGLTHVLNRQAFTDLLSAEFAYALRHRAPLSVLMIDIDHFKVVNDTHGHPAGDHVLIGVARTLSGALRTEDILARYGGEEFVVLLRETYLDAAKLCAERCRRVIEAAEFLYADARIHVTISIGIALLKETGPVTAEALVKLADDRLYEAKSQGRNRVSVQTVASR